MPPCLLRFLSILSAVDHFLAILVHIGRIVDTVLLAKLPGKGPVLLYAAPGKLAFYRKHGFGLLKTGMALFPNPERYRAEGYLE